MKDYIVRDSSIWQDDSAMSVEQSKDCSLKIGVVRDIVEITGPDIAYIVEAWVGGKYTPVQCTRATKYGGVYNYEEYTYRGFEPDDSQASDGLFDYKKGDTVLIAYLYGDSREGIIISCINHPARQRLFGLDDNVVYQSEFNGINKSITKDGEYTVTFKGMQTNIAELETPVTGEPIPAPEYDATKGYTKTAYLSDGSWYITDNHGVQIDLETGEETTSETYQSIAIDKTNEQILITSGKTQLVIDKKKESYNILNKITTFDSADEFSINTKKTIIKSTDLIDMDATDIKSKGKWTQTGDVEITGGTKQTGDVKITGGLDTSGPTNLAGGANPLIYEIVLIKGTGNKGAPVISVATVLKTSLTKAT